MTTWRLTHQHVAPDWFALFSPVVLWRLEDDQLLVSAALGLRGYTLSNAAEETADPPPTHTLSHTHTHAASVLQDFP